MKFLTWLTSQKPSTGLKEDNTDTRDYLKQYINKTSAVGPTERMTTTSRTMTQDQLQKFYYNSMMTNSIGATTASTNATFDPWTKKEKETLANVGFTFDRTRKEWNMRLSIDVKIPQLEGMDMLYQGSGGERPTEQIVAKLKYAKELLVEKLTAKIILAELVKPRKIKE